MPMQKFEKEKKPIQVFQLNDELGEYEEAGSRYHESAKRFNEGGYKEEAIRAYKRGIASYYQVEDHEKAEELNEELGEVSKDE